MPGLCSLRSEKRGGQLSQGSLSQAAGHTMIGRSSGKMKFEGFDDEVLAFGMGIKQSLTVDPLYQIFPENKLEIVNKT